MRHLTFTQGGRVYRQISKPTARKLYESGKPVVLYPSNMNPMSAWGAPFELTKAGTGRTFEALVNEFTYYNCTWATGYRVTFYACDWAGVMA